MCTKWVGRILVQSEYDEHRDRMNIVCQWQSPLSQISFFLYSRKFEVLQFWPRDSFFIQLKEKQRLYRLSVALAILVFEDAKCNIS